MKGRPDMASLRVTQYPHFSANPYQTLMADQLEDLGLTMAFAPSLAALGVRVLGRRMDVVYLHWIHAPRAGWFMPGARFCLFALTLLAARLRGIGIVWTVHISQAHEDGNQWIDWFYARTAGALAHRVIVQGPTGARVAAESFRVRPGKIATVKHGNYAPIIRFCPPRERIGPRRFLAWGQIRAYKGFGNLAEAFAPSDLEAELTICGKPIDAGETARLIEIAHASPKVTVRPEYLDDAELNRELGRTDFVVLPYQDVVTSGALLMSLTAARPVIVPRIGDLEAYVDDRAALFYDAEAGEGIFGAMRRGCPLGPGEVARMCGAVWRASQENAIEAAAQATRDEYLRAVVPGERQHRSASGRGAVSAREVGIHRREVHR